MSTFFFDIDGTLAFQGEIAKGNVEVLKSLREQGHTVFICTGRQQYYASSLFDNYVDGYIANNGRHIIYKNECLLECSLSENQIIYYDDMVSNLGGLCIFTGKHQSYIRTPVDSLMQALDENQDRDIQSKWENEPVYSFCVCYQSPNTVKIFQDAFKGDVIFNDHHNNLTADASTKGFDKGDGIEFVIKELQLDASDTYAFGDGTNDICMFRSCAHTIAMGNAVDSLKEKAEMVSSHFQEGGIENALKAYHIL